MEGEWRTCPVHGLPCDRYCEDCARLVCRMCSGHKGCECVGLEGFLGEREARGLLEGPVTALLAELRRSTEAVREKCKKLKEEYTEHDEELKRMELDRSNQDEIIMKEQALITKIKNAISEVRKESCTKAFKRACDVAAADFDVIRTIEDEVSRLDTDIIGHKQALTTSVEELGKLCSYLLLLEAATKKLSGGSIDKEDDELALILALLKEIGLIHSTESSVLKDFTAFDGIEAIFPFEELEGVEMKRFPNGVSISDGVKVDTSILPKCKGIGCSVTLSHNGILAVYWTVHKKTSTVQKDTCKLKIIDLNGGDSWDRQLEEWSSTAFYDNNMIILTTGHPLREVNLDEFFATEANGEWGPELKTLTEHTVSIFAETTLVNTTRKLVYTSEEFDMHIYDVDERKDKKVAIPDMLVNQIASFSGILSNVLAVFEDKITHNIYSLSSDYIVTKLLSTDDKNGLRIVLPSGSSPDDITKAGFRCGRMIYCGNKYCTIPNNLFLETYQSLIRLKGDIFLGLTRNEYTWILVRIDIK